MLLTSISQFCLIKKLLRYIIRSYTSKTTEIIIAEFIFLMLLVLLLFVFNVGNAVFDCFTGYVFCNVKCIKQQDFKRSMKGF